LRSKPQLQATSGLALAIQLQFQLGAGPLQALGALELGALRALELQELGALCGFCMRERSQPSLVCAVFSCALRFFSRTLLGFRARARRFCLLLGASFLVLAQGSERM
jgi:hypothetical protein